MRDWPRYQVRGLWPDAWTRVEVYRRCDASGDGPCLSIYEHDVETFRFDLFEPAHVHRHGKDRDYYPAGLGRAAYVELAVADLARDRPRLVARAAAWIRTQIADLG